MSNFERVLNKGEELHPMVNKEFFTIPIEIEMEGFAKKFFNTDLNKFIKRIKQEERFKDFAIDYVRKYFNQEARKVITDKSGEEWFFIDYKKVENKPYSLYYVQSLCKLNKEQFLENYTDLFGNRIEFEVYDV